MGKFTEQSKMALAKQYFAGCPAFDDVISALSGNLVNEVKESILDKDIIQYTKRGKWYNLPYGLNGEIIERIMYYKGRGIIFYNETLERFYFLPFALAGEIDCEGGRWLDVTPLIFGGSDDNEKDKNFLDGLTLSPVYDVLIPEQVTEDIIKNGCVILNDRTQRRTQHIVPRAIRQAPFIDLEANMIALIRTAMMNKVGVKGVKSTGPDDSTKIIQASKSKWLYALAGFSWLPLETGFEKLDIDDTTSANLQEMFMALQSIDNMRLDNLGILNGGVFEKQGTILETEAKYGTSATQLVENDYVYQRQKFCNIVNSIYGTKMWYEPLTALNMDEPVQDEQNESTNMMYDNEISQSNSNDTSNKEGE